MPPSVLVGSSIRQAERLSRRVFGCTDGNGFRDAHQTSISLPVNRVVCAAAHIGSFLRPHASRRTPVAYEQSRAANTVSCKAQSHQEYMIENWAGALGQGLLPQNKVYEWAATPCYHRATEHRSIYQLSNRRRRSVSRVIHEAPGRPIRSPR